MANEKKTRKIGQKTENEATAIDCAKEIRGLQRSLDALWKKHNELLEAHNELVEYVDGLGLEPEPQGQAIASPKKKKASERKVEQVKPTGIKAKLQGLFKDENAEENKE